MAKYPAVTGAALHSLLKHENTSHTDSSAGRACEWNTDHERPQRLDPAPRLSVPSLRRPCQSGHRAARGRLAPCHGAPAWAAHELAAASERNAAARILSALSRQVADDVLTINVHLVRHQRVKATPPPTSTTAFPPSSPAFMANASSTVSCSTTAGISRPSSPPAIPSAVRRPGNSLAARWPSCATVCPRPHPT